MLANKTDSGADAIVEACLDCAIAAEEVVTKFVEALRCLGAAGTQGANQGGWNGWQPEFSLQERDESVILQAIARSCSVTKCEGAGCESGQNGRETHGIFRSGAVKEDLEGCASVVGTQLGAEAL